MREEWLQNAVEKLRLHIESKTRLVIPSVLVSCGFPSSGGASINNITLGECWAKEATFDGTHQIFINPTIKDPVVVLETLVHELIHSLLPTGAKHGPQFKDMVKRVGLVGKAKHTSAGDDLKVRLTAIATELGEYDNKPIILQTKNKKGPKSTFKLHCPDKRQCKDSCHLSDKLRGEDYAVTVGKKAIKLGIPKCPCGVELVADPEDAELIHDYLMDNMAE